MLTVLQLIALGVACAAPAVVAALLIRHHRARRHRIANLETALELHQGAARRVLELVESGVSPAEVRRRMESVS